MLKQEIQELLERKQKLLESIKNTKEQKKNILKIVQDLVSQYNSGRISREEYDERLKQNLDKRTPEQWIKYYDDFLAYYDYQVKLCDKLINGGKFNVIKKKIFPILLMLVILVSLIVLVYLFLVLKPVGFLEDIGEKGVSVSEEVSGEISEIKPGFSLAVPGMNYEQAVVSESSEQYQAVLGKPVKWKTNIKISEQASSEEKIITLPKGSEVLSVKKIEGDEKQEILSSEVAITGKVVGGEGVVVKEKKKFLSLFGKEEIEIKIQGEGREYEIEYLTQAPVFEEEQISADKKRIIIKGPDNSHYENILSFAELPRELGSDEKNKVKIYWINNGKREKINSYVYDTDEDGYLDYIEWITPYLSEAVFEIVIEITKAEHLDFNKNFISDIYEEVRELDEVWSEEISDGEYVRIVFEQELDNGKVIDFYARGVNLNILSKVEVYVEGGNEVVALFEDISEEGWYYASITGLAEEESYEVFDLKVVSSGGGLEFDYIRDFGPISNCPEGMISYWTFDNDDYLDPVVVDVFDDPAANGGDNEAFNGVNNGADTGLIGQVGQAFGFDSEGGDYDVVLIDNKEPFNFTKGDSFSVSLWYNLASEVDTYEKGFMGNIQSSDGNNGFSIWFDDVVGVDGLFVMLTDGENYFVESIDYSAYHGLGEWHMMSVVFEETRVLYYADGDYIGEDPFDSPSPAEGTETLKKLTIGNRYF